MSGSSRRSTIRTKKRASARSKAKSRSPTPSSPIKATCGCSAATGGRRWPREAPGRNGCCGRRTSTKNKAYSDVIYVEELIGPDTVNTMPMPTLDAFRARQGARYPDRRLTAPMRCSPRSAAPAFRSTPSLPRSQPRAHAVCRCDRQAQRRGGCQAATSSAATQKSQANTLPPPLAAAVEEVSEDWRARGNIRRLWRKERRCGPAAAKHSGWAGSTLSTRRWATSTLCTDIGREDRWRISAAVLLLGMGGSSLGPEVLAASRSAPLAGVAH